VTFFFDNCVSRRIAHIIRDMRGTDVRHLRDEFPQSTIDPVWIPEIGSRGWVLFSGDGRILRNPAHRQALAKANIVSYFVYREFPAAGTLGPVPVGGGGVG
jgi:hypothetical protein